MPTLTALVRLPLVYLSAALAIGAAPQGGVQKPPPPPLQAPPQRPAAPAPSTPRTGAPPPPAAQTADAWLSGIMQSTGTTRAALLQSLGKVRVAYRPGRVSTIIPPAEASAIIAAEARKIGLEVVASAPATLVVELQRGKGYEVSLSGRLGSASTNVFEISAQAWIQVDADVLREDGYHRGPVAIASAFLGTLDRGDDITRETCERLLQGVVPLLPRDAALRDEIVPDAEWAALIQTQRPQAQSLYAPLLHAPRRTMDAPGALAGITRVARTDVGLSPFNELFYMNLIENFFGFGRMWQPEPVWTAALNSASVIVGSARIVPRYLPIVTYRVSGGAIATNELGGREQTLVGAMGEAALVERNCLVATPAGVARINCRSWLSSRMASGFHTGGEQHVVTQLEAAMKDQAAALGIELAWSGANPRAAASTAMLLPAAANTPRTAYDEINAGKPRAQHQPLLYVDAARRTYIAGLTADGATFRILEVPVDNIKRAIADLEASLARYYGKPNATRENLELALKQQFTSYAFAKDGYPRLYPYTSSFTDAAARAPRRDFEDVEIPLPGAPAASASIAANATVALAAGLALTGPPVWVAVEASGDCLAMVNQRSLLDFRAIDLNTLSITKGHVTFKHRNGREVFLNYGDDETASSREAFIRARVQACRAKPLTLANVPAPLRYGAQPILDYGSVAEEFSPPMPTDASREYTVKMTKERPGSLYELRIGHIGLFTTWSGHDMQNQRRWGSAVVSLLSEDVGELYTLMRTGPTAGQQVIGCWYDGEGPRFFWYKERPAMADPARLKTRVPNHPFLEIGAPRDKCPASWAEAR